MSSAAPPARSCAQSVQAVSCHWGPLVTTYICGDRQAATRAAGAAYEEAVRAGLHATLIDMLRGPTHALQARVRACPLRGGAGTSCTVRVTPPSCTLHRWQPRCRFRWSH